MEHQAKVSNKPLHYAKIALKTRKELAHLVEDRQWSISKASKKLGIRPSTGKLIMKKYREEGIFFQKKQDKQARLATNTQDTISQVQQDQKPQQNVPNVLNYGTLPLDYTGMANNIYLLSGSMNILQNKFWGIADWSFIGSGLPQHVPWGFYS